MHNDPPNRINVSFRFSGKRLGPMPFLEGVNLVAAYLEAERKAFITIQSRVRADQGLAAFFSDRFVSLDPPTEDDFSKPYAAHERARNLYIAGVTHPEYDRLPMRALGEAVEAYNDVHKKFFLYREAMGTGGERVQTMLEVTMMVAGATFSAAGGIATASYVGGSLLSAELTGIWTTIQIGRETALGVRQEFSVGDIAIATAASFVSSLISGKLADQFAAALARRWMIKAYSANVPYMRTFNEIVQFAERFNLNIPIKGTTGQQFMAGFIASFGADRLMDSVVAVGKWFNERHKDGSMQRFLDELAVTVISKFALLRAAGGIVDPAGPIRAPSPA